MPAAAPSAADDGNLAGAAAAAAAAAGPTSFFVDLEEDDEGELAEGVWVPLAVRPEWAGFAAGSVAGPGVGLEEPQGRVPVVAVDYTPDQREVLAYFRAVVAAGETSARALALTEEVTTRSLKPWHAWPRGYLRAAS